MATTGDFGRIADALLVACGPVDGQHQYVGSVAPNLGVPLPDVLAMLTTNPARALGLDGQKGALAPGADADLVFLDERLEVAGVMTRGLGGPNAELTRA